MVNLETAFKDFLGKITPNSGQQEQMSKRSLRLVEILKSKWGPQKVLAIGSVGRGTEVAPAHDVDWMIVLDQAKFEVMQPANVLAEVKSSLQIQ